jgi:predicted transcriptional regulator
VSAITTNTVMRARTDTVRERRDRLGLTRAELAVRADCSMSYLQVVEAGALPRLSNVMPRIEKALTELEAAQGQIRH